MDAEVTRGRLGTDGDSRAVQVLAFGNNSYGQLGIGVADDDEEHVFEPTPIASLEGVGVIAAAMSLKHSVWLTWDGLVYTAGDNDDGQLGRQGKRSKPFKLDAIEHLPIEDIGAGTGFTVLAAQLDGRLLGVGRGDRGQLGMGGADREQKERVKFSSALGEEQLLTISAGEAHCAALCRSGHVLTFGENKNGQLGLGDFVSTATPKPVAALHSRPVVRLCCGGSHTMARTATGLLWAWGCNEHGQLGLGDLKPRFRPEQVKALRVSRCADVAAGSRHTLALSERGLVLSFGSGGSGQLGSGGIADSEPTPRVVDALREVGQGVLVACGHSHSMALVFDEDSGRENLYCWGLGSSGQLGLPRDKLKDRKYALLPQRLKLEPGCRVLDIVSGPTANHTFLLLAAKRDAAGETGGSEESRVALQRHSLRTAIDADELLRMLRRLIETQGRETQGAQMKMLTKAVGAAFSSASVLNASFRSSRGTGRLATTEDASGVDLLKVRKAYHTLVFELRSGDAVSTLGRATVSLCDELARQRVPTDDPENLSVFLVLFENPLLLAEHRTSLFTGYHLAVQRLMGAVLSLPKDSQRLLFGWLKHLPSEYFARVVDIMQQYITFVLTQPGQNKSDASAAVMMLQTLWDVNNQMSGIVPEWYFQNSAISQSPELQEHYRQWRQEQSHVFSYCKYPFLLDVDAKRRLLSFDANLRMESALQELVAQSWRNGLPAEATLEQLLQFRVRREHLLSDFCGQLWWRIKNKPECLGLSFSVEFVGEFGIDAGGLRKECLQMVWRQLCEKTSLFFELEEIPGLLWFRPSMDCWSKGAVPDAPDMPPELQILHDPAWIEHLPQVAGAIVGLAAFGGIYLDIRMHPLIYKYFVQRRVSCSLEDLRAMHPTLYRSLATLRSGSVDIQALALTWEVRLPGADFASDLAKAGSSGGSGAPGATLKQEDVERFVQAYAEAVLTGACRAGLESFVEAAVGCMAVGGAFSLCTAQDLELLICGLPEAGSFAELEAGCSYSNGYSAESQTVRHFWKIVHGLSESWKRRLLLFCTGSDRIPILGLKALRFVIAHSAADLDHLPTANTCVNQLNLPDYGNLELTRTRLLAALEHHTGFGFA
eukprot:TRINITY_DN23325_c0_g1_i1.p1 TRINITY_DN23325_c0_g1~~TRINITY_DN23325_c0_g1_i1.p1  ORF type:complete len:1132 (-),score=226.18 TRINITY_DN23325_c0_g1_i1:121-3453(-)